MSTFANVCKQCTRTFVLLSLALMGDEMTEDEIKAELRGIKCTEENIKKIIVEMKNFLYLFQKEEPTLYEDFKDQMLEMGEEAETLTDELEEKYSFCQAKDIAR